MEILVLGYVAAVLEIVMGMPQARQSYQQRKDDKALSGVSLPGQLLMLFHTVLWVAYGILTVEIPITLAHSVAVPVYFLTVYYVTRSRLRVKKANQGKSSALAS